MTTDDIDSDNEEIGVMFRYQEPQGDQDNCYRLRWENKDGTNDKMYLDKIVNGHHTMLATKYVKLDRDVWYTLKITLNGNSIRVDYQKSGIRSNLWYYVFGVTDSSLSSGTIALYCWRNKGAWFDDVLVKKSGSFIDLDFDKKNQNDTKYTVFTSKWTTVNGDWDLSIAEYYDGQWQYFVEDQEDFYLECNEVYKILDKHGYTIRYLSVDKWADADGTNDIDFLATNDNIEYAITNWMASHSDINDLCFIYVFDHGYHKILKPKEGWIYVDNNRDGDRKDSGDELKDTTMGNWLDEVTSYDILAFVLEACYGGTFVDDCSGNNRIVITSSDYDHCAQPKPGTDWPAFSYEYFFPDLDNGANFAEAFNDAAQYVDCVLNQDQHPLLDDNGDGEGSEFPVPNYPPVDDGFLAIDVTLDSHE